VRWSYRLVLARWLDSSLLEPPARLSPSLLLPEPSTSGIFTMALVSMRELLDHAAVNGYGIPAFNVNNLEQGAS
jgi:hypothetical protein